MRLPLLPATALLLAACTLPPPRPQAPAAPPDAAAAAAAVTVAWSVPLPAGADALASWTDEAGGPWLIAATGHALAAYDGDSGEARADRAAAPVDAAGLAVFGDHLFAADPDGHRVQVLALPDLAPVGSVGAGVLAGPAGVAVEERGPDALRLSVADPARARVERFALQFDDQGRLSARADGGIATAAGARPLAVDPADGRLLVAMPGGVRAYTADGRPLAAGLPAAVGLGLWTCPDGGGYWLLAEPGGELAVFDRGTFAPRGRLRDADGRPLHALELHPAGSPRFPAGALYAAAGAGLAAYDLRDLATALSLAPDCVQ